LDKRGLRRDQARTARHRIDEHSREIRCALCDTAARAFRIVEAQSDHFIEHGAGHAAIVGSRDWRIGATPVFLRAGVGRFGPVVCTVIGAFDFCDRAAACECACSFHRKHHSLRTRGHEADAFQMWHAGAEQLRQLDLTFGWIGEAQAAAQLALDGRGHRREAVAMDERSEVCVQIQEAPTVDVEEISTFAARDIARRRVAFDRHSRRSIRKYAARSLVHLFGSRTDSEAVVDGGITANLHGDLSWLRLAADEAWDLERRYENLK
jgi:hypothetical protein